MHYRIISSSMNMPSKHGIRHACAMALGIYVTCYMYISISHDVKLATSINTMCPEGNHSPGLIDHSLGTLDLVLKQEKSKGQSPRMPIATQ